MAKNVTDLLPFLTIVAVAIVEYFVARAWTPAYFRYGLPLFRKRVEGVRLDRETEARVVDVADKEESLIDFQRLSESEIAFREQGHVVIPRLFYYSPVIHGLLRYVPEEGATYVIGWLNFFVLAAFGAVGYIFFYGTRLRKPWAPLVVLLLFGVLYAIGVWRYRMIAKWLENRS